MAIINKLFAISLFLFCSFTYAINENIVFENENRIYARLLLSDDNRDVISVAKTLYHEKSKDPAILDLVAEVMTQNIQDNGTR